jgi:hypothetical protein
VLSERQVDIVARYARSSIELAIKLEVGPERIGVLLVELAPLAERIGRQRNLSLAIVNAHRRSRRCAGCGGRGAVPQIRRGIGPAEGSGLDAVDPGQFLFAGASDRADHSLAAHSADAESDIAMAISPLVLRTWRAADQYC